MLEPYKHNLKLTDNEVGDLIYLLLKGSNQLFDEIRKEGLEYKEYQNDWRYKMWWKANEFIDRLEKM